MRRAALLLLALLLALASPGVSLDLKQTYPPFPDCGDSGGNHLNFTQATNTVSCGSTAGASTGSAGVLVYSALSASLSGTRYLPVGGGGPSSATELDVDSDIRAAATISNMGISVSAPFGAGNSAAFTWRKNGADTSLTCTISGASATDCGDTTHSFAVVSGDLVSIKVVYTGTIIVTPNYQISTQIGTTTSNGTVNSGTNGNFAKYAATGTTVSDGPTVPTGTVVGTTDTQTLSAKTLDSTTITKLHPGTQVCFDEEFLNPLSSAANLNWTLRNISGTSTFTSTAGLYPHIGLVRVTSAAADGNAAGYGLDTSSAGFADFSTNTNWEMYVTFFLLRTTTSGYRIGLATSSASITPADTLTLRYDTALSDTNFMYCRRAASDTENCVSSGVAADTNWHTLRIFSTVAGTVTFTLDGAASQCFTSAASGCGANSQTMPTAVLSPSLTAKTVSGGATYVELDRWAFCWYGLTR